MSIENITEDEAAGQAFVWLAKTATERDADIVIRHPESDSAKWEADIDWPWGETLTASGESAIDAVIALSFKLHDGPGMTDRKEPNA